MVKQTSLVNLKCCLIWAVDDKLIYISAVVGHKVVFLDQANEQGVLYSLGVIPYSIIISQEITNLVGVCHS